MDLTFVVGRLDYSFLAHSYLTIRLGGQALGLIPLFIEAD
jgi:hypothetical protein